MQLFRRKKPRPPEAAAPPAGPAAWYGKLPALGDFASRRLDPWAIEAWDDWLSRGLAGWRAQDPAWLEAYLAGPCWRFLLSPAALSPQAPAMAGALLPSVDRVGRYYPLLLVHTLPAWPLPLATLAGVWGWLGPLGEAAAGAMLDDWSVDQLEQALAGLGLPEPADGEETLPLPAWVPPLALGAAAGTTWWWCDDGAGRAAGIAAPGLPEGDAFRHLIAGDLDALAGLPSFERLFLETPR